MSQQRLAEMAGVSRTTVTRALSNDSRISLEVGERIRRLAAEHGYRLNAAARSIAMRRNNAIGVVLCDRGLTQANYGSLVAGVELATRAAGYRLQLSLCDTTRFEEDRLPPMFEEMGVDGVILTGNVPDWLLDKLDHWMMPSVLMGSQAGRPGVSQVTGDPWQAGVMMARHLWALGHRRIGVIVGPRKRALHKTYAQAFASVLMEQGVSAQEVESRTQECDSLDMVGPMLELFGRHPDLTALFCNTDMAAWDAVQFLRARGRAVPGDVSVAGVGGRGQDHSIPVNLTGVDIGLHEMAKTAVELLISSFSSQGRAARRVVVEPRINEGATAGRVLS
jgi:LacI family transcriptional regulator, sucrose operon repressor